MTGNDIENGILLTIATSGDFSEAGDLSPCFLKQGGKCSITVSFTPTQAGTINGSVTIRNLPRQDKKSAAQRMKEYSPSRFRTSLTSTKSLLSPSRALP